jgi:hypothetical protein
MSMMVLRNHNVYGFGSVRWGSRRPVRHGAGNDACAIMVTVDWEYSRALLGLT